MAIIAVMSEYDSADIWLGNPTRSTNSSYYDNTLSRCAFRVNNVESFSTTYTAQSEVWVHLLINPPSISSLSDIVVLYNVASGKPNFRWAKAAGSNEDQLFQYSTDGTAWTTISTVAIPDSGFIAKYTVDMYFKRGPSGAFKLFLEGRKLVDVTGTYNSVDSTFDGLYLASGASNPSYFSQIIVATDSTVGSTVETVVPNATGTHSAWSGTYTDINSVGTDTDPGDVYKGIHTNTASLKQTSNIENMSTLPAGRSVRAVATNALSLMTPGSTPTDANMLYRLGGVDYTGAAFSLDGDAGLSRASEILDTNDPAGNPWTEANVNALEVGAET